MVAKKAAYCKMSLDGSELQEAANVFTLND